MISHLNQKHCQSCEGIGQALTPKQINKLMPQLLNTWQTSADYQALTCSFSFHNFYETMAFVNALAWIANTENHHPDLQVGYNYCHVSFSTHALNGLTHNDFICAAKIDALLN